MMPQQGELAQEMGALTRADLISWAQVEQPGTLIADISTALTGPPDEELRMARLACCLVPTLAERCVVLLADANRQRRSVAASPAGRTPQTVAQRRCTAGSISRLASRSFEP